MLMLKACPKCRGDLHLRTDMDGRFLSCIQCGYSRDLPTVSVYSRPGDSKPAESRPAYPKKKKRKLEPLAV